MKNLQSINFKGPLSKLGFSSAKELFEKSLDSFVKKLDDKVKSLGENDVIVVLGHVQAGLDLDSFASSFSGAISLAKKYPEKKIVLYLGVVGEESPISMYMSHPELIGWVLKFEEIVKKEVAGLDNLRIYKRIVNFGRERSFDVKKSVFENALRKEGLIKENETVKLWIVFDTSDITRAINIKELPKMSDVLYTDHHEPTFFVNFESLSDIEVYTNNVYLLPNIPNCAEQTRLLIKKLGIENLEPKLLKFINDLILNGALSDTRHHGIKFFLSGERALLKANGVDLNISFLNFINEFIGTDLFNIAKLSFEKVEASKLNETLRNILDSIYDERKISSRIESLENLPKEQALEKARKIQNESFSILFNILANVIKEDSNRYLTKNLYKYFQSTFKLEDFLSDFDAVRELFLTIGKMMLETTYFSSSIGKFSSGSSLPIDIIKRLLIPISTRSLTPQVVNFMSEVASKVYVEELKRFLNKDREVAKRFALYLIKNVLSSTESQDIWSMFTEDSKLSEYTENTIYLPSKLGGGKKLIPDSIVDIVIDSLYFGSGGIVDELKSREFTLQELCKVIYSGYSIPLSSVVEHVSRSLGKEVKSRVSKSLLVPSIVRFRDIVTMPEVREIAPFYGIGTSNKHIKSVLKENLRSSISEIVGEKSGIYLVLNWIKFRLEGSTKSIEKLRFNKPQILEIKEKEEKYIIKPIIEMLIESGNLVPISYSSESELDLKDLLSDPKGYRSDIKELLKLSTKDETYVEFEIPIFLVFNLSIAEDYGFSDITEEASSLTDSDTLEEDAPSRIAYSILSPAGTQEISSLRSIFIKFVESYNSIARMIKELYQDELHLRVVSLFGRIENPINISDIVKSGSQEYFSDLTEQINNYLLPRLKDEAVSGVKSFIRYIEEVWSKILEVDSIKELAEKVRVYVGTKLLKKFVEGPQSKVIQDFLYSYLMERLLPPASGIVTKRSAFIDPDRLLTKNKKEIEDHDSSPRFLIIRLREPVPQEIKVSLGLEKSGIYVYEITGNIEILIPYLKGFRGILDFTILTQKHVDILEEKLFEEEMEEKELEEE